MKKHKVGKRILSGMLTGIMVITLLTGIPMGEAGIVNAARRTLKNPSKNSIGVVTWDCVYFGNYPQSDATGETKEPIKWRVLSVNGDDAFLVADQSLDVQRYNDACKDVTWETCTIRSWLNGYGSSSNVCGKDYSNDNFINRAFTDSEQSAIRTVAVENKDNLLYGTEGGNNTIDKVFLLSCDEVTNPDYGFSGDYSVDDEARKRKITAYVAAGGTIGSGGMNSEGSTDTWWLRSPGYDSIHAMYVSSSGFVLQYGNYVNSSIFAVCPALHLNLSSSNLWTYAGTVSSDGISTGCMHENTELKGRSEATCNEGGHTGAVYCSDCGMKLKDDNETIPAKGHLWDNGIITKEPTEKEEGIKTFTCTVCGETRTEPVKIADKEVSDLTNVSEEVSETSELADIPKEVQAVTDESIAKQTSEDVKGAVFNTLRARATKLTNKTITLKWNKVSKADGYKIYGNQCGKKNHYKLLSDVEKNKTSYTQKKLKKGTYYKYVVAAYKVVDSKKVTIAVSKTIHATTTGGKYGVAKSVKVNKTKVTLKKGKKFTIKAKEIKQNKTIKRHRVIAYESSNTKVATVSKKGIVRAKSKGTCYIYVYAQNGAYKRVKVMVK